MKGEGEFVLPNVFSETIYNALLGLGLKPQVADPLRLIDSLN